VFRTPPDYFMLDTFKCPMLDMSCLATAMSAAHGE